MNVAFRLAQKRLIANAMLLILNDPISIHPNLKEENLKNKKTEARKDDKLFFKGPKSCSVMVLDSLNW